MRQQQARWLDHGLCVTILRRTIHKLSTNNPGSPLFPTFFKVSALTRVVIGFYSIIEVGFYLDKAEFSALNCIIVEIRG
jgi:hypothetical protein